MGESRHRPALIVVAWVASLVAVLFVVSVAASATVLPATCGTCHMKGDFRADTQDSAHGTIACSRCHVGDDAASRLTYGLKDVAHTSALLSPVGRGVAAVDDKRCLDCHDQVNETITTSNGVNIQHATCTKGSTCTDCHSTVAHGEDVSWARSYSMEKCLRCHAQTAEELAKCDTCHEGRRAERRVTSGTWAITHGANWRKTHGMGDSYTCSACHQKGFCDKCHGVGLPHGPSFREEHSSLADDPEADCRSCHDARFCTDCHGVEMPHPPDFKREHSSIASDTGEKACRTCHSQRDCNECHERHVHPGGAIGTLTGTAGDKSGR